MFADVFTYSLPRIHDFSVISNSSLSTETPEEVKRTVSNHDTVHALYMKLSTGLVKDSFLT